MLFPVLGLEHSSISAKGGTTLCDLRGGVRDAALCFVLLPVF